MTSQTFKIDNTSPLIQYSSGQWTEGNPVADPKAGQYFGNKTFTLSTVSGASATFTFNGTGIAIGGAKRDNHGTYSINLDGNVTSYDGFAPSPFQFQVPLFSANNLKEGLHTITITNTRTDNNKPFLDVDFVEWNSTMPATTSRDVEDTDGSVFTYQPPAAWSTNIADQPGYSGGSGHLTNMKGAQVSLNFEGDAIDVRGSVGPNYASYVVELDGINEGTFNATKSTYYPQQLLYHADNLGLGNHILKFTQQPGSVNNQVLLGIDFTVITPYEGPKPSLDGGDIGGIVFGVLAFVAIAIGGLFIWMRERRRRRQMTLSRQLSISRARYLFGSSPNSAHKLSISGSSTVSHSSLGGYSSYPTFTQPSYPDQAYYGSNLKLQDAERASGSGSEFALDVKQPISLLPPSSLERLDHISPDELRSNRMDIPGREQDFGPAPVIARLPPDYNQATQQHLEL